MRLLPVVFFMLLLFVVGAGNGYAQVINIAPPQQTLVPAALANIAEGVPVFYTTNDGRYAVAYTKNEAKAWKLPEGELVYRYQAGSDDPRPGKDYYNKYVNRVTITADGRYIYVSGRSWSEEILDAADLESGELVPDGLIMDSLKAGAYQMQRSVSSFDELEWDFRLSLGRPVSSPLYVKRNYEFGDKSYEESPNGVAIAPAKLYPGEVIICFKQEYCRSGKWLRDVADKENSSVKEIEKIRQKNDHCQYMDFHAVRLNLTTRKATYLGQFVPGVQNVDYKTIDELHPSPYGDVVAVGFRYQIDSLRFYNYDGQELWRARKNASCRFQKYDDEGNVVLREKEADGTTYIATRKPLTGVLVSNYKLPKQNQNQYFLDQWGMTANIGKGPDGNFTLTLNDAFDGKMMMALTDEAAAAKFANNYKAEVARVERERQERIRQNQLRLAAWEEQKRKQREEAAAREKTHYVADNTAATHHDSKYKTCPACGGSGGEYVQETYTEKTTTTLWGGPRVGAAGYQTTTKTYNTPYKKFVQCNKCWGKGEVRK